MKPILTLAFLATLATPAGALDIYSDHGGLLYKNLEKYSHNRPHRIFGECYSSCTVVLRYSDTCIADPEHAVLGFHVARGSQPRYNRLATQLMMRMYPRNVREWIRAHGGLVERLKFLRGRELTSRIRRCS